MRSFRLFAILVLCSCAAALHADVLHELLGGRVFPRRLSWSAANEMLAFTDEHQTPVTVGFYHPDSGAIESFPVPCAGCNDGIARAYIEDIFATNGGAWFAWTRVGMDGSPLDGGMNSHLSWVGVDGTFENHAVERQDAFRRFEFGSVGHSFIVPSRDGNKVWFTMNAIGHIGSYDVTTGAMADFPLSSSTSQPSGIVAAPDGNVYATMPNAGKLAEISLAGVLKEYTLPKAGNLTAAPYDVAAGLDGALVITDLRGRVLSFTNHAFSPAALDAQCVPGEIEAGGSGEFYVGCGGQTTGSIGHLVINSRTPLQIALDAMPFEVALPAYPVDIAWNGGDVFASVFEVDGDARTDHLFGGDAPARCDLHVSFANHRERITSMTMYSNNIIMQKLGYDISVLPAGGTGPYTIVLESDLPQGLAFSFDHIHGYPEIAQGRFVLLFRVTDRSTPACEIVVELPLEIVPSRMKSRAAPH